MKTVLLILFVVCCYAGAVSVCLYAMYRDKKSRSMIGRKTVFYDTEIPPHDRRH